MYIYKIFIDIEHIIIKYDKLYVYQFFFEKKTL